MEEDTMILIMMRNLLHSHSTLGWVLDLQWVSGVFVVLYSSTGLGGTLIFGSLIMCLWLWDFPTEVIEYLGLSLSIIFLQLYMCMKVVILGREYTL